MNNIYDAVLAKLRETYGEFSVRYLGLGPETTFAATLASYFWAASTWWGLSIDDIDIEQYLDKAYATLENPPMSPAPPFEGLAQEITSLMRRMLDYDHKVVFTDLNGSRRLALFDIMDIEPGCPVPVMLAQVQSALTLAARDNFDLDSLGKSTNKLLGDESNVRLMRLIAI